MSRGGVLRKIQLVGGSSYAVVLPREWVEALGLTKGSVVTLERTPDGAIKIIPVRGSGYGELEEEAVIDFRGRRPSLGSVIRLLVSAYVSGYDRVRLLFDDDIFDAVDEARRLAESIIIGFVAIEEARNEILFTVVADAGRMSLQVALAREARAAELMLGEVLAGLEDNNWDRIARVPERDQLVDRLYLYIARYLVKALSGRADPDRLGLKTLSEAIHYFAAAKSIERVADHATLIANRLSQINGERPTRHAVTLIGKASTVFSNSVSALLSLDVDHALNAARSAEEARSHIESRGVPKTRADAVVVESAKRIAGYSVDIAEAAIDIVASRGSFQYPGSQARVKT